VEAEIVTTDPLAIGRKVKEWLVGHMSSGPCVAAVLEGNEAPRKVRKLCGATLPNVADPGTIRFDFSCDSPALANREKRPVFNLVHASDPDEENSIAKEIELVFRNSAKQSRPEMQRFFSVDCGHAAISGRSCGRVFDECTGVVFKHRAQATNGIAAR